MTPTYQKVLCALFPLQCAVVAPGVAIDTVSGAYDAQIKSPVGEVAGRLALATAIETSGPVPIGGMTGLVAVGAFCAGGFLLTLRLAR